MNKIKKFIINVKLIFSITNSFYLKLSAETEVICCAEASIEMGIFYSMFKCLKHLFKYYKLCFVLSRVYFQRGIMFNISILLENMVPAIFK